MNRYLLNLFTFFVAMQNIFCQPDFRPGYIITYQNDTVYGLIDYRGDLRNSNVCSFKKEKGAEANTYSPYDIRSYRYTDSKYYISKSVYVDGKEMKYFLEYLVDGIADLYFYRDINSSSDHYLIEKENGNIYELTNDKKIVKYNETRYVLESKKYIGLLKATFKDCNEIQTDLNDARLDHKSLINLTEDYHNYICKDRECIIYEKPIPVIVLSIAPSVSLNCIQLLYAMDEVFTYIEFDKEIYPSAGISLNFTLPRINEKISAEAGTELGKNQLHGFNASGDENVKDINKVYIDMTFFKSYFSLTYAYPIGKTSLAITSGGEICHIINYSAIRQLESKFYTTTNFYELNDVPVPDYLLGIFGGVGFNYEISRKIEFIARINYNYFKNSLHIPYSIFSIWQVKMGIFFSAY